MLATPALPVEMATPTLAVRDPEIGLRRTDLKTDYLVAQQDAAEAAPSPVSDSGVPNAPVTTRAGEPPSTAGFETNNLIDAEDDALSSAERTVDLWEGDTDSAIVQGTSFPVFEDSANLDDAEAMPPLPGDDSEEDEILEPESLAGRWDFARLDSPIFGTEEIAEFSRRQIPVDGNWRIRPLFSLATLYDGNIFISEGDQQADFIVRAAPGVAFRIGDGLGQLYLTGNYTAGFVAFSSNSNQDSIDQNGNIDVQWTLPKTTLGLHLGIYSDTGTSIDVTDRVRRNIYYAGITSNHIISSKSSIDLDAAYSATDYPENDLISSQEVRLQTYFNYDVLPKVSLGIGGVVGFLEASPTPDQVYVVPSLRAVWLSTGKITLTGTLGADLRRIDGQGQTTPVFGLAAVYRIRYGTELTVNAARRIFNSAVFGDQNYVATGITMGIKQRLTDRCNLLLTGGFENNTYENDVPDAGASRVDNYFFIRPAVQYQFTDWLALGFFYEYSQNDSRGAGARSFRRDRGGLQINIIY